MEFDFWPFIELIQSIRRSTQHNRHTIYPNHEERSGTQKSCRHNQQHCLPNCSCDLSSTWLAPWYAFAVSISMRFVRRPYWKPAAAYHAKVSLHLLLIGKMWQYFAHEALTSRSHPRQIQVTGEIPNRKFEEQTEWRRRTRKKAKQMTLTSLYAVGICLFASDFYFISIFDTSFVVRWKVQ